MRANTLMLFILLVSILLITKIRGMKLKSERRLTYEEKVAKCEEFIRTFEDYELRDVSPAY